MSDDSVPFNPMSSDAGSFGDDGSVEGLGEPVVGDVVDGEDPAAEGTQEEVPPAVEAEAAAPVQAEEPISKDADRWAKNFDKLSRKDLDQRKKEKELKVYEESVRRAQRLDELAKGDKLQLLRELGVSVDDVLRAQLNGGRADTSDEVEALKAKVARLESAALTPESLSARDEGNMWEYDFKPLYSSNEYEIVRDTNVSADAVRERTLAHYNETGELLPPKVVLDTMKKEIQNHLNKLSKYIGTGSGNGGTVLPPSATSQPVAPIKTGPKTLTPKTAAVIRHTRVLDDEEEMAMISAKYTRADR